MNRHLTSGCKTVILINGIPAGQKHRHPAAIGNL
jgi:hypothetical protein